MRIGILTSSRADFGIYLPLLKAMKKDSFFAVDIIAFGTHLSSFHGETVNQIVQSGFEVKYQVESMLLTDSADAISTAIGLTTIKFADFWKIHSVEYDLVFCLGDRYEMFAAVTSGIPFNIKFAHIHGGETTLGAIDNVFRHSITLASKYHFASTDAHAARISEILSSNDHIYNVGALSLDNLKELKCLSIAEFEEKWRIDLAKPTILVTFHPETVAVEKNKYFVAELIEALKVMDNHHILITMPNADTSGNVIRAAFIQNFSDDKRVSIVENLGSQSYFTAMKYCAFLLGNTSSGIIEAASFGKYVINLGKRQYGRTAGPNVISTEIKSELILGAVKHIESAPELTPENMYWNGGAVKKVISSLKAIEK